MPSDRSTMQRGLPGAADQQSPWQEPTAPSGRRLPSAPRERKPALAALAVLLILGCALGTGYLVLQSGKRVSAIEITQEVGVGQKIPVSAMTEVQIAANTGLSYVPWNQAQQVSHYFAANVIPSGTLLTNSMVSTSSTSTAGRAVMGLALKDGQVPRGLRIGDHIDIFQVSDSTETCPGHSGETLSANAIVLGIVTPNATSGSSALADVEVALNPDTAGSVACNASNGIVGIAVLPNGGRGAQTTNPGGAVPGAGPGNGGQGGGHTRAPGGKSRTSSPNNGAH